MEVLLYDESGQIAARLIELTEITIKGILFRQVVSVKQLIKIIAEQQPVAVILHLAFANRKAAELLNAIIAASNKTVIIALFDVADDYNGSLFNIRNGNYVFDTYKDFDKIPGVMREIMKKNQLH